MAHLVKVGWAGGAREAGRDSRRFADGTGRRAVSHAAGAGLLACVVLALLAGGCGGENLRPIIDESDFRQLLKSDKPVVVDFHKGGGCPPCKMLLPILDKLADEYQDRVIFASYEIITPFFQVTSEEIKQQYDIFYIPTVILFVRGKEVKRWPLDFMIDDYRKVLDGVVGGRTTRPAVKGQSPPHA